MCYDDRQRKAPEGNKKGKKRKALSGGKARKRRLIQRPSTEEPTKNAQVTMGGGRNKKAQDITCWVGTGMGTEINLDDVHMFLRGERTKKCSTKGGKKITRPDPPKENGHGKLPANLAKKFSTNRKVASLKVRCLIRTLFLRESGQERCLG